MSNLTSWPILRTPGASSSGFRSAIASASAIWSGARPAAVEEIVGAGPMADRDVAGLSRLDRQRDADEVALQRVGRRRLGVDGDDALVSRARDPGAELGRGAHDLIGRAVDRSARLLRARGGEVRGRSALRSGLGCAAREQGAASGGRAFRRRFSFSLKRATPWPPGQPAGPTKRGSGSIEDDVDAANLGDAAGERRELHRFAKGDEPLAVELRRRERLERRLDRHVAIQGDELLRDQGCA